MAVLGVVACSSTAFAQARTFAVEESGGSRVRFISEAPLERMTGVSTAVSGEFTANPSDLASARGAIEVRVATIRTGIDLRDEHLRSDSWLDAARFPVARFELTGVRGATSATAGHETRVQLRGRFSVHGHSRDVTAEARVTWDAAPDGQPGPTLRIRARFSVRLTDFGVTVPSIVELKVANEIAIDVNIVARVRS